jgi:hypothetical protein
MAIAALFSLTLAAPALAGEDVTEHDTYEKRSMKIETVVPAMPTPTTLAPSRVYEHHDESESITTERHSATPPAPVVKERTRETAETKVVN